MNVVGLDIGGANLKASDGLDRTLSQPFPLWECPEGLAVALSELLSNFPAGGVVAVTMTGELADCFRTRREGVHHILDAVENAAAGRDIWVWQTSGEFVSVDEAREFPSLVAAANWHALATWGGRMAPVGNSLLIDVGSTTTDIIPIEDGNPVPEGRTDLERLQTGELIYLGARRTPVHSLLSEITFNGVSTGLARELFATTLDAHLWLGLIPEDPTCHQTANGRPCTREAAADRLARMVCSDLDELTSDDIDCIARNVYERELELIRAGIEGVVSRSGSPVAVLLTGEGEYLAREILRRMRCYSAVELISLTSSVGEGHSVGACSFALARLAFERWHSIGFGLI